MWMDIAMQSGSPTGEKNMSGCAPVKNELHMMPSMPSARSVECARVGGRGHVSPAAATHPVLRVRSAH